MKTLVKTKDFIKFLKLFGDKGVIYDLEIGDTTFEKEGYINESIFIDNHTIEGILKLNYGFHGLVHFQCKITEYQITLKPRLDEYLEFEIESNKKKLIHLEHKIIELNAFEPGLFEYLQIKQLD